MNNLSRSESRQPIINEKKTEIMTFNCDHKSWNRGKRESLPRRCRVEDRRATENYLEWNGQTHTLGGKQFLTLDSSLLPASSDSQLDSWNHGCWLRSQNWNQKRQLFWFPESRMESKEAIFLIPGIKNGVEESKNLTLLIPFLTPESKTMIPGVTLGITGGRKQAGVKSQKFFASKCMTLTLPY